MKGKMVLLGIIVFLMSMLPVTGKAQESDAALGERMVRSLFANPETASLAKGFQAINESGARDCDAEKKRIATMKLGDYALSDFKVTREGNVLVVTYIFTGHETMEGKMLSKQPVPRLSVFIETDQGWQLLAHANLAPASPSK